MTAIIAGVATLLFLVSAILLLRELRSATRSPAWLLLACSLLVMAVLSGILAYQGSLEPPVEGLEVLAFLLLTGAVLSCVAVFLVARSYQDALHKQTTFETEADRYRQIFENSPGIHILKDRQSVYLAASPAYAQFLGKGVESLLGKSDYDFFPRSQANVFRQEEEGVMEMGVPQDSQEEMRGVEGMRWFHLTRTPVFDGDRTVTGVLVSGLDISELKVADQTLDFYRNGLAVLAEAEGALSKAREVEVLQEKLLAWAGRLAGTAHVCLCKIDRERPGFHIQLGSGKLGPFLGFSLGPGEDVAGKAMQSGQACLVNDYMTWQDRAHFMEEAGFTAAVGLPLRTDLQFAGVLCIYYDKPGQIFQPAQMEVLRLFARIASTRLQDAALLNANREALDERGRTLERLHYRLRLERILAAIATHFISIPPDKIEEGIRRGLQSIEKLAEVERCTIVLFSRDGAPAESLVAWQSNVAPDERDVLLDLTADDFQWHLGKLNQLEMVYIPRAYSISPEFEEGVAYLKNRGIKSLAIFPMVANRTLTGFLRFETVATELEWPPEILGLFKLAAEMFVYVLERKWSARILKESQEKTQQQIASLEQSNWEGALITEMGDLLQACRTADEAYPIIARYVQRVILASSGALYMIHDAHDPAESVAAWGEAQPGPAERELVPNECWGVRRGRLFVVGDVQNEPVCGHVREPLPPAYLCAPLIAQGLAVGVLHLRATKDTAPFDENRQRLATKIAEYIALALTNLKLRDELRSQAIRDPLTGLFNRRYMEETLEREIRRASRHTTTVGVIMFDIDRLKPINDTYGHDAGDFLLRALGLELLRLFRGEDVACRYGGDEFTIVLPEASLADVWRRAEQLRDAVKKMDLKYDGDPIGPLTLSIGVAAYPDHGLTAERVLLAADAASYASKSEGGDRIMVGRDVEA